jgi:hypothetical protein
VMTTDEWIKHLARGNVPERDAIHA